MSCLVILPESQKARVQIEATFKKENIFIQLVQSIKSPYFILLFMVFSLTFGLAHFETAYPLVVTQKYGFTTRQISILVMICSLGEQ